MAYFRHQKFNKKGLDTEGGKKDNFSIFRNVNVQSMLSQINMYKKQFIYMKNWLFFFLTLSQSLLYAQNTELGLLVGASIYTGDIEVTPRNFLPQTHPAVGLMGRKHFNEKWAVRAIIAIGGVSGDEKKYPTSGIKEKRGYSFKGTMAELSILPEWRPFTVGNVAFYAFTGLSAVYVNPKSNFNEQGSSPSDPAIVADQNEKYPKVALSLPMGGGLQWHITQTTALGAEISLRKTFTDYLDGFGASANTNSNDYYFLGGITFSKFFSFGNDRAGTRKVGSRNRGVNCPSFN